MTAYLTSTDGTRIAYDSQGSGPGVILVAGAMQFRAFDPTTVAMARLLAAEGFTVVNFDRRGRGDTATATSFTLSDTVEDLRALIDTVGGPVALVGNSSGGAISLAAAAAGLNISELVLFEVPLRRELGGEGAEFLAGLREKIAHGNPDETVEYFMKDMPAEWLEGAKRSPAWTIMTSMGSSLEADAEALAWAQSAPRAELFAAITARTLVLVGEQALPIFPPAAESIAGHLAQATLGTLPGTNHGWDPAVMAARVAAFLKELP